MDETRLAIEKRALEAVKDLVGLLERFEENFREHEARTCDCLLQSVEYNIGRLEELDHGRTLVRGSLERFLVNPLNGLTKLDWVADEKDPSKVKNVQIFRDNIQTLLKGLKSI